MRQKRHRLLHFCIEQGTVKFTKGTAKTQINLMSNAGWSKISLSTWVEFFFPFVIKTGRFMEMRRLFVDWKHRTQWKTCNTHVQALNFLHCRNKKFPEPTIFWPFDFPFSKRGYNYWKYLVFWKKCSLKQVLLFFLKVFQFSFLNFAHIILQLHDLFNYFNCHSWIAHDSCKVSYTLF